MFDLAGNMVAVALLALLALITFWVFWVGPRVKQISVFEWEWALLFRDGRFDKILAPGKHTLFGKGVTTLTLDRRPQLIVIPGQEVLTKDGLGLKLSVVAQYQIEDAPKFVKTVAQSNTGGLTYLYNIAQLPIRTAVAGATLDDILANRDSIPSQMSAALRDQFKPFGLALIDVAVRDIMLSREIRDAFAATAVAQKQGQAALERARSEVAAMRALANAARIARDNPEVLKLRALQGDAARQTLVVDLGSQTDGKSRQIGGDSDSDKSN
jgi:regulator of protease activity HflC (stomatin/prohibitin superfamily)